VAITPDGGTVVVAGPSFGNGTGYATVACNAAAGAALWTRRVLGCPVGVLLSTQTLAVSPDSSTVYVAGPSPCGFVTSTTARSLSRSRPGHSNG
jgi:DNA-binding beta-propeller fold protein YncE